MDDQTSCYSSTRGYSSDEVKGLGPIVSVAYKGEFGNKFRELYFICINGVLQLKGEYFELEEVIDTVIGKEMTFVSMSYGHYFSNNKGITDLDCSIDITFSDKTEYEISLISEHDCKDFPSNMYNMGSPYEYLEEEEILNDENKIDEYFCFSMERLNEVPEGLGYLITITKSAIDF